MVASTRLQSAIWRRNGTTIVRTMVLYFGFNLGIQRSLFNLYFIMVLEVPGFSSFFLKHDLKRTPPPPPQTHTLLRMNN